MPRREGGREDDLFAAAPLPVARLDDGERLACLRLIRSENVGPVTFRALINHYGGAAAALEALPELSRRGGRGRPVLLCPRETAEVELEAARAAGARPLFTIEPGYPALLAHVEAPPPMLYVMGRAELLNQPIVGMVGSREASAAGAQVARQIADGLGKSGYVVASGLARGIDAAAHRAALATGTVAVIAGGIGTIYPPEHAELQAAIGREGCVASEQPPGFQPRGQDFPRRNRIIAGISHAVLVVEAARRSGSLITARMAGEQGREVMAVPGHPLDPRAEGTNQLIKDGATMVTGADDIVRVLEPITGRTARPASGAMAEAAAAPLGPPVSSRRPAPASQPELAESDRSRVLAALGPAPVSIDEIGRAAGLSTRAVQVALLELTLAGRIDQHGGQLVSLRPAAD